MWLRRNTKVLDSFPPQKREVLCNQVTQYSALLLWQTQMMSPPYEAKNYGSHTIAHVHNSVFELLDMHFLLKQNDYDNCWMFLFIQRARAKLSKFVQISMQTSSALELVSKPHFYMNWSNFINKLFTSHVIQ